MPKRPCRPLLVIAYAGVDEHVVMRGLYHVALDAEHDFTCGGVQETRLQPGTMPLEHLICESREKLPKVDYRDLLFNNLVNSHLAECEAISVIHCRFLSLVHPEHLAPRGQELCPPY